MSEITPLRQARRERLARARLYAILDFGYVEPAQLETVTQQLVDAGVDLIQLRAKNRHSDEVAVYASKMRTLIPENGPLFIINDHPGAAQLVGADGAHIGQDDCRVASARAQAGPDALIGKSTHSLEQAVHAEQEKPDYIGVGPIFPTATKPDYQPVGLSLIRRVREQVSVPQFCIGGVNRETLPQVLAAGGQRVVVVSALLQCGDISAYARSLRQLLDTYPLS